MDPTGGSVKAHHLCVLVHGLWGNPDHMGNVARSLRTRYSPDELYLLLVKRNSGSFTYDGIERGGERVCAEIEEELRAIRARGGDITKLSIVGYSLGGLVSRYAVGLLHAKGILDQVECVNFTTFASPHLGVRTPLKGWHNHIWNVLGARTLSMSGRQLFMIDKFRDTGRPLLSVLADPSSIFMRGLRRFKRHSLYTNIINDKSTVYYTSGIEKTDPYKNPSNLLISYLDGCENVVIDASKPPLPRPPVGDRASLTSVAGAGVRWAGRVPFLLTLAIFVPIGVIAFLLNSVIQTFRSSMRIRLHEQGQGGINVEEYRVPLLIKELREEVEHVFETLNSSQDQEYLGVNSEDEGEVSEALAKGREAEKRSRMTRERRLSIPSQPTLALTADQFEMIDALNSLGWRKYPVWVHKHRHTHAVMIVRMNKKNFDEGWIVLRHYVEREFLF